MALLFYDGCDLYGSNADIAEKWDSASGVVFRSTGGRFGGGSIEQNFTFDVLHKDVTAATTMIAGGAYEASIAEISAYGLIEFREGTTIHTIVGQENGFVVAWRASINAANELGRSATRIFFDTEYHYVEAKVFVNDTTGSVVVHVDGKDVLNLSNEDTANGGTPTIDRIKFAASNSGTAQWDDMYIADTNGGAPTDDFLGDCQIDTLMPDGDGFYTEYGTTIPSSPTTHWDKVEEQQPDDDTSYNEGTAVNQRDTFTMENLTAITTQTIYAVQLSSFGKHDGTATNFRQKLRISGTDYDQGSQAHASAYTYHLDLLEQDPNAGPGAWAEGVINGMESGYEEL